MEDREKPSWAIRVFGPLIFIFISMAAFAWFFYRFFVLITGIGSEVVILEKGSFYMLGVGVGTLALSFAGVLETWLGKTLTQKATSFISKMGITGVVLMFTLPHLIHYIADDYLESNDYSICVAASHQWLFVRDIVYVQESITCSENLLKEITN